jgi:carboxypeptidase family protein
MKLAVIALVCIFSCGMVFGQATAQISGTVRDQSGAVLPGVEVIATQTDTGIARNVVTNETGSYVLPNLAIGPYKLEAALPGFRSFVQNGIVLLVNSSPVINPVMQVGQVNESIEVQANATLVETRSQGVGQVIENARILELPLNGRNVTEMILLAGAAVQGVGGGGGATNPFTTASSSISIAGGLSTGVTFNLDGINHNHPGNNYEMPLPFPDALQEFKVETSALSAQNGMHSAGAVSGVTRSGTNDLHGDLFEFVRNYKFNARNFFARRRDSLKRNQFGGTAGGPIIKNKLFFFGGYQGTIIRQDPAENTSFVPTPAMLAGDFTAITAPACNAGRQIPLRAPFVGNRIDPALFSKPSLAIVNHANFPRTTDPCGRVLWGARSTEDGHQFIGRLDYQRSSNHSIFGRYLGTPLHRGVPYKLTPTLLATNTVGVDGLAQSITLGDTYLIGPNIVNAFRFAGNRVTSFRTMEDYFDLSEIGVKMYTYLPHSTQLSVTGGFTLGGAAAAPGYTRLAVFALADDVSIVRGNHQFGVGMSGSQNYYNYHGNAFSNAPVVFNGQATGLGLADFLTGNVFSFIESPGYHQETRQRMFALYGQDVWKVTSRLTVNAGLRWEPFLPAQRTDLKTTHFDLDLYKRSVKSTVYTNAPAGLLFPGDSGFPNSSGMYYQWRNSSPRVGLAWDINGDGRTSLRASYGLFFDVPQQQYFQSQGNAPPWLPRVEVDGVRFEDPWAGFPGGNPYPLPPGVNVFTPYARYLSMNYDTHNPTVSQWNLALQRQVGSNWLASASYLGSNSVHLWTSDTINPAVYLGTGPCTLNGVAYPVCSTPGNTDQRRRLSLENPAAGQYYGFVYLIDDGGTASYNGLILSLQRRPAHGVTLSANYTWSHCISDPVPFLVDGTPYTHPQNRRADRGNCETVSGNDRRHIFNLTSVAETPQFSNQTLRMIATGWRLSPILRLQSGGYFTVTTSSDLALDGIPNQRVNQVLENVYGDKSYTKYLNPAAFALPATGTRGNLAPLNVLGPGYWQFDVALSRTFPVKEGQRMEFRAEAFNLTNSTRLMNPVANLNAGNFGQITTARDPRIMQFALKYIF